MTAALPAGLTLDRIHVDTQHAAADGLLSAMAFQRRRQGWELIGAFTAGHFTVADNAARHVAKFAHRPTVALQFGADGALVRALEYSPETA